MGWVGLGGGGISVNHLTKFEQPAPIVRMSPQIGGCADYALLLSGLKKLNRPDVLLII